jgi:hypothetical protein
MILSRNVVPIMLDKDEHGGQEVKEPNDCFCCAKK